MNFELFTEVFIYIMALAVGYLLGYSRYHSWFMKNIVGRGHYEGGPCEKEKKT